MVLNDLLTILKNDETLKVLLNVTPTDNKIHMGGTREGIAYKYTQLTNDGIKTQDRLEVYAIHKDYEAAYNILERVKQVLLTRADEQLNNDILEVSQNGGSSKENEDTHYIELGAFFIVKSKYRKMEGDK